MSVIFIVILFLMLGFMVFMGGISKINMCAKRLPMVYVDRVNYL